MGNYFTSHLKRTKAIHSNFKTTLPPELILMLAFNWDHVDPSTKTGNVCEMRNDAARASEILLCQLFCCFCHRHKSCVNGDYRTCWMLSVSCGSVEDDDKDCGDDDDDDDDDDDENDDDENDDDDDIAEH